MANSTTTFQQLPLGSWIAWLFCDAMEIFDACGFHPEIGIKVLIQKSLITIDSGERFGMHDLIQEMGHHIVRREHPHNPEEHSRVWKHEEVSNMCSGDATVENDQIQAIDFNNRIDLPHNDKIMLISKMKKLRWLRLIHARIALEGLQGNSILHLIIFNEVCNLCSSTERARLASEGTNNLKDYMR
ncbi:Toll/interleukin-1 receptor domain-containing protein [Tanacetum coccineum]